MRTFIYDVSVFTARLLLPLFALLSAKIKKFRKGRHNLMTELKTALKENTNTLFWVHCSSVGEFEQGLPVIELLKKENPTWKVIVTFFSPSGYEAVNNSIIDYKFYLPYDTRFNARQFIKIVNPQFALFVKYEFWHHFLKELKIKNIPTYSVSSIFRPTQAFFKWWGSWNKRMLNQFTYFMVQDETSLKLLKSIGITNAEITGDTRFDRVLKIKEDTLRFPEIENFIGGKKVFIVGSLRPEDDNIVLPFIKANTEYRFIIAPHEITEKHISKIENTLDFTVRHSELSTKTDANILIIDSIGKLSRLYRLAHFAYIGGGFSDGIHNILEPAVYNIPVFFGDKYYKKYKEATDLTELQASYAIADTDDLTQKLKVLESKSEFERVHNQIESYVNSNIGASIKVVNIINQQAN